MSFKDKLNPWNWFHHEDSRSNGNNQIPITKQQIKKSSGKDSLPITQLRHHIDELIHDAFNDFSTPLWPIKDFKTAGLETEFFKPNINISGDEHSYLITLDVPGLKSEDISIDIKDHTLKIYGEKKTESENKERQFYRIERHYGCFERTLNLPEDIDIDAIEAAVKDGVLTLSLPRQEQATSEVKKIPIS